MLLKQGNHSSVCCDYGHYREKERESNLLAYLPIKSEMMAIFIKLFSWWMDDGGMHGMASHGAYSLSKLCRKEASCSLFHSSILLNSFLQFFFSAHTLICLDYRVWELVPFTVSHHTHTHTNAYTQIQIDKKKELEEPTGLSELNGKSFWWVVKQCKIVGLLHMHRYVMCMPLLWLFSLFIFYSEKGKWWISWVP